MPTTFVQPDPEALDLMGTAMRLWHDSLAQAAVKVGILMAANDEGHAVMHGGYPAVAKIKPVALKDRALGKPDAELIIDLHRYEGFSEKHRLALFDHELSHIALIAKKGEPDPNAWWKLDDLGRPKLTSVKGDWMGSDGFEAVAQRHGDFALEVMSAVVIHGRAKAAAALFDNSKPGPASEKVKRERNK